MKITIESTTQIVECQTESGTVQCRVWEGVTEGGVKVACLVPRIAAHKDEDLSQFERELKEQLAPTLGLAVFPLRMIL